MADQQFKADDIFHAIGFTRDDILSGALMRALQLSSDNLRWMASLAQKHGALAPAADRGVVVRKLVEVYFADPFVNHDDFRQRFSDKYQTVQFWNETAMALSNQFHIQLPPVIAKLTRTELPPSLGTSMRFGSYAEKTA